MSLDICLKVPGGVGVQAVSGPRIFIREEGRTIEISRDDWNMRFPGREPVAADVPPIEEAWSGNITHNLATMARAAEVYQYLWRPHENGFLKAGQLIAPLKIGLRRMRDNPEFFKRYNPANGWGDYYVLVNFVAECIAACEKFPDAEIEVSR